MDGKKIIIATYGTRGDIQPLLALALALQRQGHEVRLAAPPEHAAWVTDRGCAFSPLGSDFSQVINRYPHVHTLKPLIDFLDFFRHEIRKQLSQLPGIIDGADLVLGASLCMGLRSAAELAGIPYGFVAMAPQMLPSAQHPFIAAKAQNMPLFLNRLSWKMACWIDQLNLRAVINKERRNFGLAPIKDVVSHVLGNHVMVASDPVLAEIPSDVGLDCTQTGYLHLAPNQGLQNELQEFFASGPAPIYFGFGSMSTRDQEALVSLILKCLDSEGRRGILTGFRFDQKQLATSADCIFIKQIPHPLIFPRVAAVVHHGGSGTTATAAMAGVPQIIVPHILDQYYWAERIFRRGLGPNPIRRSRLTAGRMAKAIHESLSDNGYQHRAKEVAKTIKPRDSLRQAVEFVEATFFSDVSTNSGLISQN